ncbi:SRPBCC family protein [Tahibacter amnicola]|uniref:SRPBCC family protein n=1 Tax=Tahibacter amnicola TaxID=2976241 RepID=A0ABY6BL76_9GAMM|nr:SRPBCC family protein [Tahibacter amnicola]UXI69785.1 SRPBCC family protein [Tahibacter amnicola]
MTSSCRFELVTHWHIPAPREVVWKAIRSVNAWPSWWPYVTAVEEVDAGGSDGVGACHRLDWSSRLPYSLRLVTHVVEVVPQSRLRASASGDLRGEGRWSLADTRTGTAVEYLWRVELEKRWMQRIARLARPVFEWNHQGVMAAGERGLTRHLRTDLLAPVSG